MFHMEDNWQLEAHLPVFASSISGNQASMMYFHRLRVTALLTSFASRRIVRISSIPDRIAECQKFFHYFTVPLFHVFQYPNVKTYSAQFKELVYEAEHITFSVASLPGLPRLQFLIAKNRARRPAE